MNEQVYFPLTRCPKCHSPLVFTKGSPTRCSQENDRGCDHREHELSAEIISRIYRLVVELLQGNGVDTVFFAGQSQSVKMAMSPVGCLPIVLQRVREASLELSKINQESGANFRIPIRSIADEQTVYGIRSYIPVASPTPPEITTIMWAAWVVREAMKETAALNPKLKLDIDLVPLESNREYRQALREKAKEVMA